MSEDPFSERLKRLEDRIEAAKATRAEPAARAGAKYTQGSLAWRMVTELVAGMLLGLGIGWGLDALFRDAAAVSGRVRPARLRRRGPRDDADGGGGPDGKGRGRAVAARSIGE